MFADIYFSSFYTFYPLHFFLEDKRITLQAPYQRNFAFHSVEQPTNSNQDYLQVLPTLALIACQHKRPFLPATKVFSSYALRQLLATMPSMERYQPPVKAPEFPSGYWLNTLEQLHAQDLLNKVTLVDIFDFTCINCLRTLPYLRAWQERYENHGLQIIGIHTPEFKFAQDHEVVKAGISRLGIHWPVILDNDQTLWTAYANRYWPSLYLINSQGKICYRHIGEGGYRSIESTLQEVLLELDPDCELPDVLPPLRPEDAEGATCAPTSPEIQLGAIDQIEPDRLEPKDFDFPDPLEPDRIYLKGSWRATADGITLSGKVGEIALRYKAARVHAVLAPKPDDRGGLPNQEEPLYIQVLQDGEPLERDNFGQDILASGTQAQCRVDFPRLYEVVKNPEVGTHELRLIINHPGFSFYAFTFGSCITPDRGS